ncbi:Protein of unknown function [Pyronema omphalodes CBS 100304]|uniref:Uncharacterized protein n=1 Tax=Pyronema omphalodes (strain CBS 100304) TaxID=1076935 RepID=U4LHD8_PYROM|nr:Protein of unknown function [Pyronema omphalodes CBS 100304]
MRTTDVSCTYELVGAVRDVRASKLIGRTGTPLLPKL